MVAGGRTTSSSTTTTTTSTISSKPPIAQAALPNLLLTPAEVDSVLGVTGSKTDKSFDTLQEDHSTDLFPKGYRFPAECLCLAGQRLDTRLCRQRQHRGTRQARPGAHSVGVK